MHSRQQTVSKPKNKKVMKTSLFRLLVAVIAVFSTAVPEIFGQGAAQGAATGVARTIAPTIVAFGVSPTYVVQGDPVTFVGFATKGSADIKRYRVYVISSRGGAWTMATAAEKSVVSLYVSGMSTSTNSRSFYGIGGLNYAIRFEVEDVNGLSSIWDAWLEVFPIGSARLVVSAAPESPRRTAYRESGQLGLMSVREIKNPSKSPTVVQKIKVRHSETFNALYVEIGGYAYLTKKDRDNPGWQVVDIRFAVEPGATIKVSLMGTFIWGAKSAWADIAFVETVENIPYVADYLTVEHAIVDEIIQEGLASVRVTAAVSPREPAIMSFTVKGQPGSSHKVLVRAIGPSLRKFGVENPLADPNIRVLDNKGNVVGHGQYFGNNDNWISFYLAPVFPIVGAFALDEGSLDAAVMVDLTPGDYTAELRASGTGTGVVRLEAYQVPPAVYSEKG